MKRSLKIEVLVIVFLLIGMSLFAGQYNTVPLDSSAYRIIDWAEIQGIIPKQTDAKPYTMKKVVSLFEDIKRSGLVSGAEVLEIEALEENFNVTIGQVESRTWSQIAKTGYLGSETSAFGFLFGSSAVVGKKQSIDGIANDFRLPVSGFIRGDFGDSVSYYMTIGISIDKYDPMAFKTGTFRFSSNGFVFGLKGFGDSYPNSIPNSGLVLAMTMSPELVVGLFDDKVTFKFSSVNRDWGVGRNNLQLSGSAKDFVAIEINAELSSWIRFNVLTGSLEKYSLSEWYGVSDGDGAFPSEYVGGDKSKYKYDNNFSSQRVELSFTKNFTFSIYESVIWKKRFELAYLNPLSIYMFDQNALGDLDNMLAGVDFDYVFNGIGRLYFALAMTEAHTLNPKEVFTHARNIIAYQFGFEGILPVGNYGTFQAQFTYLPPFFYSHYEMTADENPWHNLYNTTYVNKGVCLGYPLNPDSIELLLCVDTGFDGGLDVEASVDLVLRSAQYARTNAEYTNGAGRIGTTILTTMDYDFEYNVGYNPKDFFSYIWSVVTNVEVKASKKFDDCPVTLTGAVRLQFEKTRDFEPLYKDYGSGAGARRVYYGEADMKDWDSLKVGVYASFGAKVFY